MKSMKVHRVNFFDPPVKAIHCLSYEESSERLAVGRSDFSVEIWDMRACPFLCKVFKDDTSSSVEAVAWFKGKLFSVGLHGCIIEYDFQSAVTKTAASTGHGIWCVEVNKSDTQMAIGTEDGYVCIYRLNEDGMELEKTFDKQEGRILCLAWHKSGEFIATGSIDTIRLWNVFRGTVCERILIGRKEKYSETIVWCIALTQDMTIISGDSNGKTSFWNGRNGTLLNSTEVHKADVLAMCLSKDEKSVYTAGVDPVVVIHERVDDPNISRRWIKSIKRTLHSHDVRALTMAENYLVSGGVDSYLVFSKYPPKTVIEFSPFSEVVYSAASEKNNYILLQYPKWLEIWKFKEIFQSGEEGEKTPFDPVKLLSLKSNSNKTIVCSAISTDGSWISYSTLYSMKLFYVNEVHENTALSQNPTSLFIKKANLPKNLGAAKHLKFVSSSKLAIVTCDRVQLLDCDTESPKILMSFDNLPNDFTDSTVISCCDKYFALGSMNGSVLVFDVEKLKIHSQLPSYKYPPTALSFDPSYIHLVVAYSDRKVISYNLKRKVCRDFCEFECMERFQMISYQPIRGVLYPKLDKSIVLFYDDASIYIMKSFSEVEPQAKHIKTDQVTRLHPQNYKFVKLNNYMHILDVHQFLDGSVFLIEIKPSKIKLNLPSPLWKKKYGT